MKYEEDSISLVLAGSWNVNIFTPEWVAKNVFETTKDITIEFSLNSYEAPRRLSADNIRLIPSSTKVIFHPQKLEPEIFKKLETAAKKLCSSLPHTPITGYGINYEIFEYEPDERLLRKFSFVDDNEFDELGLPLKTKAISRSLRYNDGMLNFSKTYDDEERKVGLNFNFHYPVPKAETVVESIEGKFALCNSMVEKVLKDIFNCTIESEDE